MKPTGALAAWLAKAKPGCCPCGRRVCRKGARLCKHPECRERYMDLWRADERGIGDKSRVTRKLFSEDGTRVRIHYACRGRDGRPIYGHHEDMVPSLAMRVGQKRRCPVCTKA